MLFSAAILATITLASFGRISLKRAAQKSSPLVNVLVFEATQVLVALPLWFWFYQAPSTLQYSLASGSLFSMAMLLYFHSFTRGEVSVLTPLRGLRGVVALIISLLWWHEQISFGEGAGVVIIGLGILALQRGSSFKNMRGFIFNLETLETLLSVVLAVFASYFDKLGATETGLYTHYLYTSLTTTVIMAVACLLAYRRSVLKKSIEHLNSDAILVGVFFAGAYACQLFALQLERVTIVNGLVPLGTLITAFLAGRYLNESIREKIPGTILMVIGAIMVGVL